MSTELYRVFYQVAECGSISKASKLLFVSQPAVSKAIKNLENNLGVKLFIRKARGVELTVEGRILYDHVSLAFFQLEEGEKRIGQLKERSYGIVRIGVSNTLCKYYFMSYLKAFHELYPQLKIEIVNRTSPETIKLLEEGLLDCAIISNMDHISEFDYYKLMSIQDIFVSKEPPPASVVPLYTLENYPMLLLEKKNATRDYLDQFIVLNEIKLNIDIEISSMEFLVEFAKIGLGVASVIKEFVTDELDKDELYEWSTEPHIPSRSIGLLCRKDHQLSLASKAFVDYMKQMR